MYYWAVHKEDDLPDNNEGCPGLMGSDVKNSAPHNPGPKTEQAVGGRGKNSPKVVGNRLLPKQRIRYEAPRKTNASKEIWINLSTPTPHLMVIQERRLNQTTGWQSTISNVLGG